MADIQFWLSYNNGAEKFRLPVNPESIQVNSPFSYEEVNVSQLGTVSLFGERGSQDFSFSSFLPKHYAPYCNYTNLPEPWTVIEMIEKWRDSRKPIQLTITGTPINIPVTIRDISYDAERFGSPGDIYYSLALKEYKTVNVRTVTVENGKAISVPPTTQRPTTTVQPKTHTVVKGENLRTIAKKIYGDMSYYEKIYQANKSTIGSNRNLIVPGMKLVLPNK
ncbi:MAG: LysM peptidoglycan-binding domain-containing protein [Bacillota bacterium]